MIKKQLVPSFSPASANTSSRLNPSLNPDIENICDNYLSKGHWFLVAEIGDELVGTAALLRESDDIGRIVRMSVSSKLRRGGLGRLLTMKLMEIARDASFEKLVVETNDDWHEAIQLYLDCGFIPYDQRNGEIHMQLYLGQ